MLAVRVNMQLKCKDSEVLISNAKFIDKELLNTVTLSKLSN